MCVLRGRKSACSAEGLRVLVRRVNWVVNRYGYGRR